MLKTPSPLRSSGSLRIEWLGLILLVLWALFAYFHHLSTPVVSDEAMYAVVGRQIVRSHEWLRLEYNGAPFLYKPPLHFWLMALSMMLWGTGEFAVRFPSAVFGMATTLLAYFGGKVLFCRRVGWLAAFITTTTFVSVWLSRKGKLDVELGFWMNLAFFAFYLAYRGGGRRIGLLILGFISLTMGTMLKGAIGLLLPGAGVLAYLLITRKKDILKEAPVLGAGMGIFLLVTAAYFWALGDAFNRYFFFTENLARLVKEEGPKPLLFYLYMIFPDLFPWSLFLPSLAAFLWTQRSPSQNEEDLLVRLWPAAFFLPLNLPAYKEEDFLLYVVPSFAILMAGYLVHLWNQPDIHQGVDARLFRLSASLLALGVPVALFAGPTALRMRYPGFPDFLPRLLVPVAILGCGAFLYAVYRQHLRAVVAGTLILTMVLTVTLVQFFFPTIARYDTAKTISRQVQSIVGDSLFVTSIIDGLSEILYYLDRPEPVPNAEIPDGLRAAFQTERKVFCLMDEYRYGKLVRQGDIRMVRLAEYSYRRWRYVLVSNREGP